MAGVILIIVTDNPKRERKLRKKQRLAKSKFKAHYRASIKNQKNSLLYRIL